MLFRTRFLVSTSCLALSLAACGDDVTGGETSGFTDEQAPDFGGVTVVTPRGTDALDLEWNAATDNISSADEISYRVYLATESGAHDFSTPAVETTPGQTSASVDGLTDGQAYYVIVHAVDEFGNEDANNVERVGTVGNLTAPDFGGVTTAEGIAPDTIRLTWSPATDAESDSADIVYNIYTAATNDGQDFLGSPIATTEPGVTEFDLTGLDDYTSYWVAVRAQDTGGREDDNTKDIEALTLDGTPPDFDGVVDVVASGDGLFVEWTAARDNATHGSDIVYNGYVSSTSGGQDFTNPTFTTAPGAFSATLDGLDLDTDYFVIVRAQDEAAIEDPNTIEGTARTDAIADQTPPEFFGVILATPVGGNTVTLQWDPASDNDTPEAAIVYEVFASSVSGDQDFSSPIATSTPGATSIDVTPLQPESEFYFVVRARDMSGNVDDNTREVGANTGIDELPPTFAGGINMVPTGPQTIELSWDAATDDGDKPGQIAYQGWVVTTQGAQDFTGAPTFETSPGSTMHELVGLEPDTEYFVVVRAKDSEGNVDQNTVELSDSTWPDTISPTFVSGPAVSQQGLTEIFVDWEDAVDDVDTPGQLVYEVYTATSPGGYDFGAAPALTTLPGITEATLTGLIPGDTYYVTVRAADRAGNTGDSSEASDTTQADTVAPTFDGVFQVLGSNANSVTIAWPEATDNYSQHANMTYHICQSLSPTGCVGGNFTSMKQVTGVTQDTITGLTVSTTYFFVVRAEDEFSNMENNSRVVVSLTTPDFEPPQWDLPSQMSDVAATAINEGQANVTWNTTTDNVTTDTANIAYDIYVAEGAASMNFSVPHTTVVGVQSTTVSGLTPNTSHRFVVRARDLAGNRTTNTDEASTSTLVDNTAPVGGVVSSANPTGCKSMSISWSAATDIGTPSSDIDYLVCVGTFSQCGSTNFSNVVKTVTGSTFTTHSVSSAGTYYVKVRARDSSNNTNTNNTSVTVDTTALDTGNPTQPTGLSLTTSATSNANTKSITVDWNDSSDSCFSSTTIDYQICRSTSSAGCTSSNWFTYASTFNGDDFEVISGLNQDTTYWIGVRAVDDEGNVSTPARTSAKTKVSWSDSGLEARFASTCAGSGCHGTNGWTFAEMVNVTDTTCNEYTHLIDGANPPVGGTIQSNDNHSRIYNKIAFTSPTCTIGTTAAGGSRMPASGAYWSSTQITDLRDWINQGAYNN